MNYYTEVECHFITTKLWSTCTDHVVGTLAHLLAYETGFWSITDVLVIVMIFIIAIVLLVRHLERRELLVVLDDLHQLIVGIQEDGYTLHIEHSNYGIEPCIHLLICRGDILYILMIDPESWLIVVEQVDCLALNVNTKESLKLQSCVIEIRAIILRKLKLETLTM